MRKLVDSAIKLVLPTATAKATSVRGACRRGCGTDGVWRTGKTVDGKAPCC
jgi:hypothetical protein